MEKGFYRYGGQVRKNLKISAVHENLEGDAEYCNLNVISRPMIAREAPKIKKAEPRIWGWATHLMHTRRRYDYFPNGSSATLNYTVLRDEQPLIGVNCVPRDGGKSLKDDPRPLPR